MDAFGDLHVNKLSLVTFPGKKTSKIIFESDNRLGWCLQKIALSAAYDMLGLSFNEYSLLKDGFAHEQ
ncbi:hypothetical protein CY34DRAFT_808363 [Suillus luteus UH-Slu-Lm8-n1]|uniref:Unplaced genomic scaffold CY34scaffold_214, whole genome shotgun sequence n=1 Tax=Suillus luteus UH-Slu-Lm8-n1 TaxID=930992 RepID=A0A0D0AYG6_9AGAM|nr:hypothetical protein CY34DRAFT_808363 [Suillus luteus UH-Slu-Lm8-n1]